MEASVNRFGEAREDQLDFASTGQIFAIVHTMGRLRADLNELANRIDEIFAPQTARRQRVTEPA